MTEYDKKHREKLIEKIKRLLALSKSPNEHEAASAAAKAAALLTEHNLSIDEVSEVDHTFILDHEFKTDPLPWQRVIGTHIAKLYFCEYFFTPITRDAVSKSGQYYKRSWDQHCFAGAAHNVIVAKLMFVYLIKTVARLSRQEAKPLPKFKQERFINGFRYGAAGRLATRINKMIEDAKAGKSVAADGSLLPALASLYDTNAAALADFLKQFGLTTSGRTPVLDAAAYHKGVQAGDKIGLQTQVENTQSNFLLPRS